MHALTAPLLVVLLAACGSSEVATGKIADPRGSSGDASVGSGGTRAGSGGSAGDRGNGGSPGTGGASGASAGGRFGAGGSVTGGAPSDSGSAGAQVDASPPPTEIPSAQTVTFHITNVSGADRYIVVMGNNCTSAEIARLADGGHTPIPQQTGFQCPCECPMPGAALPTVFHRVGVDSVTMTWDARGLLTWRDEILCHDNPPLPPRRASVVAGVLRPVEAGTYRIALGVEPSLPAGCDGSGSGPEYRCAVSYASNDLSDLAPRCETSTVATVDFSLPASGDVDVSVELK